MAAAEGVLVRGAAALAALGVTLPGDFELTLYQRETVLVQWIEENIGRPLKSHKLLEALRNGVALCLLAQTINPSSIDEKHCKAPKGPGKEDFWRVMLPVHEAQRITAGLSAFEKIGVAKKDLFQLSDIQKPPLKKLTNENLERVVHTLESLHLVTVKKGITHLKGSLKDKIEELARLASI